MIHYFENNAKSQEFKYLECSLHLKITPSLTLAKKLGYEIISQNGIIFL